MWNESFQRLRNSPWQWRLADMATGYGKPVETAERGMLALPKAGDRTGPGEKGKYLAGRDLSGWSPHPMRDKTSEGCELPYESACPSPAYGRHSRRQHRKAS